MNSPDIEALKKLVKRPKKAIVTAGMPYANGPLHLGHLAGAHVPADIYARWLRMLIGKENVLYVCGTDDHGSTSELSALKAKKPIREFLAEIHAAQKKTLSNYNLSLDVYTGTSRDECFADHVTLSQDFIRKLFKNGLLEKRTTEQWYDPKLQRFLQDRFVQGKCPNPKCENLSAYSDECEQCGNQYAPASLLNPKSTLSDGVPELRPTTHYWLNMWKVSEQLRIWVQSKEKTWRTPVYTSVIGTLMPSLIFSNQFEERFKVLRPDLPKHKSRYAPGKKIVVQFENKSDLENVKAQFLKEGFDVSLLDDWAHRSISRDVAWGIPLPDDLDSETKGKTLYVWPDSLIAPISFTKLALKEKSQNEGEYTKYWCDPDAAIYQFLGQDNVYFYTLMQGAMWIGSQKDIGRLPIAGEFQMSENIFGCFHLLVEGEKMSKSKGNFFTGDELLEKGYSPDQIRYFLALLSLPEKASNFDFGTFEERNKFLAGPLNAAFEKPLSACHSKFDGLIPRGKVLEKVTEETNKIIARYLKSMPKGEYSTLLFAIENYARQINSLFTQFKPHDDRHPEEERRDALYSCFYVLKNLMIMLYPFVPSTMEKLQRSLNLDAGIFRIEELGHPIAAGHKIGEKLEFFPAQKS